jgi:hypothetical protein
MPPGTMDNFSHRDPGNATGGSYSARTAVAWPESDVGREVALQFEGGDLSKPLVMG